MPDIIMGVEVEYSVVDGHRYTNTQHESDYDIYTSSDRATSGRKHHRHGKLVKAIEVATDDFVRVGYDQSASKTRHEADGLELRGQPDSLGKNLEAWGYLYDSWTMGLVEPDPRCGMHVHLSGDDLDQATVANISRFINDDENARFVEYVAGRYNTYFCRIIEHDPDDLKLLWHSTDCTRRPAGKIDRSERPTTEGFCCENLRQYREAMWDDRSTIFERGAVNLTPHEDTGIIELRLFATPDSKQRMAVNLEFAHALVKYCNQNNSPLYTDFCLWLEQTGRRRLRYRNLFRWLRDRQYVHGLIPRTA